MFVAHTLYANETVAATVGGFATVQEASTHAAGRAHNNPWVVVEATDRQWAAWVAGDHSRTVEGRTVATGGTVKEAA